MLDKIPFHPLLSIYKVFLAEDTQLKREVALKVLPPAVRHDPQRLARFRTEAEAAAKLNHPNLATIYSIEEADDSGVPMILDFGLARISRPEGALDRQATTLTVEPSLTEPGQILGTAPYMSPEQVPGLAVDHRRDLFSFGVVMYQALTGQRPFQED